MMAYTNGPLSLLGGVATGMFALGGFVTVMSLRYVGKEVTMADEP
jgi:hypothetical protein